MRPCKVWLCGMHFPKVPRGSGDSARPLAFWEENRVTGESRSPDPRAGVRIRTSGLGWLVFFFFFFFFSFDNRGQKVERRESLFI